VPTYEYQCEKCQRVFEVRQRITEAPLTACDMCGGRVKRLLSPAPFILKGEGWYVTDYPSEARKKAKESEKAPSNGSGDKADKPAAEKPADKPATTTSPSATGGAAPSAPAKSD
jgi:putative FmdB family regulatory protein